MLRLSGILLCIWVSIQPAQAFYMQEDNDLSHEARGLFYGVIAQVDSATPAMATTRLMYDFDNNNWHFAYHQVWNQLFTTTTSYQTQADRLHLSYSNEDIHIKLGTQAINLATTFFFSPNDFFAPFTATAFNRDYKGGVDALYAEIFLGELSQLSAMLVQHYPRSISTVLRFESAIEDASWMILTATLNELAKPQQQIIGGSFQIDLLNSIGLRAEGHISKQQHNQTTEWVIGLEHRWSNDLSVNVEWFHHGSATATSNLPYTGRQYLAFNLAYVFTPLLSGSLSFIRNMDDASQLNTATLNYSLSNETTLSAYSLQPSQGNRATAEFNHYIAVTGLELRVYF